ncbi:MAG: biopolymer transporter ExbD [Pirellulales bacterium]
MADQALRRPLAMDDEDLLVPRRNRQDELDLDITPMIDVTFLLLIFFLVTTTMTRQSSVELPTARFGGAVSEQDSIVFTLVSGGVDAASVYAADGVDADARLSDDADARREAITRVVRQGMAAGRANVLIKAERHLPHRNVAEVMKAASQVEGVRLHLAVNERD